MPFYAFFSLLRSMMAGFFLCPSLFKHRSAVSGSGRWRCNTPIRTSTVLRSILIIPQVIDSHIMELIMRWQDCIHRITSTTFTSPTIHSCTRSRIVPFYHQTHQLFGIGSNSTITINDSRIVLQHSYNTNDSQVSRVTFCKS